MSGGDPVPSVTAVLGSDYTNQNCSIARALEAVGERWTLLIVRELLLKPRRFSELERRLPVAKNILTSRLAKLVELGIAEKIQCSDTRDWSTYQLTAKGLDLFPVVSALMAWGDAHEAPAGPPMVMTHDCGSPAGHELVCQACGGSVNAHSVQVVPGPGWVTADDQDRRKPP